MHAAIDEGLPWSGLKALDRCRRKCARPRSMLATRTRKSDPQAYRRPLRAAHPLRCLRYGRHHRLRRSAAARRNSPRSWRRQSCRAARRSRSAPHVTARAAAHRPRPGGQSAKPGARSASNGCGRFSTPPSWRARIRPAVLVRAEPQPRRRPHRDCDSRRAAGRFPRRHARSRARPAAIPARSPSRRAAAASVSAP